MLKMGATKRIAILLFVIFLMPVVFFSVYEISSLSQDEETIQEIYENQLEAILFSANQYADDILTSWISKIELGILQSDSLRSAEIEKMLALNSAIAGIARYDTMQSDLTIAYNITENRERLYQELQIVLKANHKTLNQLITYQKSGFQKIEPFPIIWLDYVALLFKPKESDKPSEIYTIIIEPEAFIDEIMGPRLQVIAQEKFAIVAIDKELEGTVYSTYDSLTEEQAEGILTKDLWLLPNHQLGISTIGESVESIIQERTKTDLLLIITLDIILIISLIIAFRNVRREVQLAQNKSEFISNVSHELRTPLALISMFAETLEMNRVKTEEKKQEYYSIIHKESQRLTDIVNKILSFSQLDAGKKQFKSEPLDLALLCKDILDTYQFHLKNNGFEVLTNIQKGIVIMGDRDALTEVIINLLDNAIKYSDKDKRIEIKLSSESNIATLNIRDYGQGISKSDQKYIFDKFYRSATGDLAKKEGTGIGLALVKKIVDAHNAAIEVKSELNQGSAFILIFELASSNHE